MIETRNDPPWTEHGGLKYTDPKRVKEFKIDKESHSYPHLYGYGQKVPTRYWIAYLGKGAVRRMHRVYIMGYGNSTSLWINVAGETVFLDSDTEQELEKARDNVLGK